MDTQSVFSEEHSTVSGPFLLVGVRIFWKGPWRISVVKYELHKTNCGGVFHWGVGEVRCVNWRRETILLHS